MCGIRSKTFFLALALLLLPLLPSFSEETTYEITGEELETLESNMERLRTLNNGLKSNLEKARENLRKSTEDLLTLQITTGELRMNLTRAQDELTKAQNSLMKAQASFDEYEKEMKRKNVVTAISAFILGAVASKIVDLF